MRQNYRSENKNFRGENIFFRGENNFFRGENFQLLKGAMKHAYKNVNYNSAKYTFLITQSPSFPLVHAGNEKESNKANKPS